MALSLESRRWGGGEQRVLLLHGVTSNAAGWWKLGSDLAERGWNVTAVDLRGHGRSPGGGDYELMSYASDVLALGIGWDAVLGHSLGGAVAVLASSMEERFARRLVLQDPALLLASIPTEEAVQWLLEPYAGHRYRVQRLLELAGAHHPRHGPRMAPRTHLPR